MKPFTHLKPTVASIITCLGLLAECVTLQAADRQALTSVQRIENYRLFAEPLTPVGEVSARDAENEWLITALDQAQANRWPEGLAGLENFLQAHPQSPWAPSLKTQLAEAYYHSGRYTVALDYWKDVWDATKDATSGSAKQVADFTLAYWSRLMASLGQYDSLVALIEENKARVLDGGPLSQKWTRTREAVGQMRHYPGKSYKCGTYALRAVAGVIQPAANTGPLMQVPSPATGFTLAKLQELAAGAGLPLVAVRRTSGDSLIVPSVIHWKLNHYAAILSQEGDRFKVVDPTFGQIRLMTRAIINAEASGAFLVPEEKLISGFKKLTPDEAAAIYGKGNPGLLSDADDQQCQVCPCPDDPGASGSGSQSSPGSNPFRLLSASSCSTCSGMSIWDVSEPFINLWFDDEPLGYQPAVGPRASFKLVYKQRSENDGSSSLSRVGSSWSCPWLSSIFAQDYLRYGFFGSFTVYHLGGGSPNYYNPSSLASNYYNNVQMMAWTNASGVLTNVELFYPDGSRDEYAHIPAGQNYCYLSQKISPEGYTTTFQYDDTFLPQVRLVYVIDANGGTNTISYDTNNPYGYISQVTDPYGRNTYLNYDESTLQLTNITDVAGLTSSFLYDPTGVITNLSTPYGTTSFNWVDYSSTEDRDRSITVTQPDTGKQLFAFVQNPTTNEPTAYASNLVPTNTPLGTLDNAPDVSDSYHWGPRQYALLSTNDVAYMPPSDFLKARMLHWLGDGTEAMDTISLSREPSPDGVTTGQLTWYDYIGKTNTYSKGLNVYPSVIARVLPDGSTAYTFVRRNQWFQPTNVVSTYTLPNGVIGTRTNIYIYDSNGIDLLQSIGPDGAVLSSYSYNAAHQPLEFTNAVNDVTTYTYNSLGQVTSLKTPAGLTTTNLYFTSGSASNQLQQTTDIEINRVNTYTYTNALVYTHTDERNLTVTNTWDNLQHLVRVDYPDGTCITNSYLYLDKVRVKDRMGYTISEVYDSMRRLIYNTNALGRVTHYSYCSCGSLDYIQDAAGNFTQFFYDNAGRLIKTVYADGFGVTNFYSSLDQLTNTWDSAGTSTTNWYNNQGLVFVSRNAFGVVASNGYDIYDRIINNVDFNGVSVTNTFDYLNRVLSRSYPDSGSEKFGYSPAGLAAYTNQIGFATYYAYDSARRKLYETNANRELTQFQYSPAGDLTNLIDGKLQSTKWNYDQYGRVTNKVDAANNTLFLYGYDSDDRLTNRWTPAKGTTVYRYDPAGNLTNVVYPVNTALVLRYDALNRLTNMVDGVGTTVYGYDAVGQLLTEDGPWADDTVSYLYTNRLRASLSLQVPNASPWTQGYGYDNIKRFSTITSPAGTFGYAYAGGSPSTLVSQLTLPNGAYITNTYDNVARMLRTILKNSSNGVLNSHKYGYNMASQRTYLTNTAGDFRNFLYDPVGQLTNVFAREANNAARLNEYQTYSYDAAHNLKSHYIFNITENFALNSLNELTNEWRSGNNFEVAGTTTSSATNVLLTVNGGIPYSLTPYNDNTWAEQVGLVDGTNTFTAVARDNLGRSDTNTSSFYLPVTNAFTYDLNGNLLSDGNRNFAYDDENQLISVWVTNNWKSDFAYDGKMRRRLRFESTWNGSAWVTNTTVLYVYDGNLVIQERHFDPQLSTTIPQQSITYTRGRDLSGTLQGSGGIGGLLARSDSALVNAGSSFGHSFYHSDANGNVTTLIYPNQTFAAKYVYDAFGNLLSKAGTLADANTYRFSSKETHPLSGLLYYLYRFYDSNLQRWLNRDPIGELGGAELYRFNSNDPVNDFDALGLDGTNVPHQSLPTAPHIDPTNIVPTGWVGWPPGSGLWSGNGPVGAPKTGYAPCEKSQAGTKTDIQYVNGDKCPDGSFQKCVNYKQCEAVGTANPSGTTTSYGWVPHHRCFPCKPCKQKS